jgi:hypothetical protein
LQNLTAELAAATALTRSCSGGMDNREKDIGRETPSEAESLRAFVKTLARAAAHRDWKLALQSAQSEQKRAEAPEKRASTTRRGSMPDTS